MAVGGVSATERPVATNSGCGCRCGCGWLRGQRMGPVEVVAVLAGHGCRPGCWPGKRRAAIEWGGGREVEQRREGGRRARGTGSRSRANERERGRRARGRGRGSRSPANE